MKNKLIICIPTLMVGGVAKVALNLTEYFLEHDTEVVVLLTHGLSKVSDFKEMPEGVKIRTLPEPSLKLWLPQVYRKFESLHRLFWLIGCFRKINPTYVLAVRHIATAPSFRAWKFALKPGSFYIAEINPIDKTLTKNKKLNQLLASAYTQANGVIANSKDVADALEKKKWTIPQKIHVVDNPVISSSFSKKANEFVEEPWVKDLSIPLIITIGRLSPMKDQTSLIKAFKIVREKINSRLMIIGEGKEHNNLQELIDTLNLSKSAKLAGATENPYPYLKRADLFVLTSLFEGFGVVLVEALALGKRVISTDCEGGPAYILNKGEYGRLVQVGDVESIAGNILDSLNSTPNQYKLIQRANDFSVNVIGKKYEVIMRSSDNHASTIDK